MEKNIVIMGAGFGGLRTATLLGKGLKFLGLRNKYKVILIDRNDYHTYTPTLYEIATTSKETADNVQLASIVTFPIEKIINPCVTFKKGEIENLDLIEGDIHLRGGEKIRYDYAVIALGSETNDFNIPGVREYALELKTFPSALAIRNAVITRYKEDPGREIRIVIGGGGSTGVELAGEIQEWLCAFNGEICRGSVTIIDGNPTILSPFPPKVARLAITRLAKLGVAVITGEPIKEVKSDKIVLNSGRLMPYDIFIWTGGVKASSVLGNVPLKIERQGKLGVGKYMECLPDTPDLRMFGRVYGLGDSICFYNEAGKPIAGVARAAISHGTIVAGNIMEDIETEEGLKKRAQHREYSPREYPYILPVGSKWAIAKIGPFILHGLPAWILNGLVELNYLFSIMSWHKAIPIWLRGLRIFIQNDRLG